jgi:hypothetical protein
MQFAGEPFHVTHALPPPLLPATVDLRKFRHMPLDVVRLCDSETVVLTEPEEFRAAVVLWAKSWHQLPASSLPLDDRLLADLAGYGRAVKEWRRVREGALRGFIHCSDGRLYHPVVADIAIDSWGKLLDHRWSRECDRLKKQAQRTKVRVQLPTFALWISANVPEASLYLSRWKSGYVPRDNDECPPGHTPFVPRENALKGMEGNTEKLFPEVTTPPPPVPRDNPTPHGNPGKPNGSGAWRRDPDAAQRKLRDLGVSTTWSTGKSHDECVARIQQELQQIERAP